MLIDGRDCAILLGPATYDLVIPDTSAWLNLCNISAGAEINDEPQIKTVDVYCSDYPVQRRISSKYSIKLKAFIDLTRQRITSTAISAGGSGYTSAPTVTPSTGSATFKAIINGGVVTQVLVTNGGSYSGAVPTLTFSGGGGTGAAATAVKDQLSSVQFLNMLKTFEYLTWYFYPRGLTTGYEGFTGTIARPKFNVKMGEADFCMLELEGQGNGDWTQVTAP